jgi:hypothetical protein
MYSDYIKNINKAQVVLAESSRYEIAKLLHDDRVSLNPASIVRRLFKIDPTESYNLRQYMKVIRHIEILTFYGLVQRKTMEDDFKRTYYQITPLGKEALMRMGFKPE